MPKLVTGMQAKHGFTLIEILVVVVIIGITLSFALLAFGDFGANRRIIVAAEKFENYVKLVQQQAILETSTLGISVNTKGYQALRFYPPSRWEALSQKNIFHSQPFPTIARIKLENGGDKAGNPEIIINASGDMTPFKLHFSSKKQLELVIVSGNHNGEISLVHRHE